MYIVYWLTSNLNFLTLNVNLFIYYDCWKVKKFIDVIVRKCLQN